MSPYKAVFLDLDNTLFSFDEMYKNVSYHAIKETIGLGLLGVDFESFYKQFRKNADRLFFEYEKGKQTMESYRYLRWTRTFAHYKIDIPEKKLSELNAYIMHHYLDFVEPFPGSKDFLVKLKNTYIVGLITNGSVEMQMAKLIKMDMLDFFDEESLIISEQVGVSKPHPVIFQHALEKAGVKPSEALHIGDSLKHDIIGANQAGFASGLIHMNQRQVEGADPTYSFKDFYEATSVLLD